MLQINVLSSSGVRQTAVSQAGTLQSLTVHWKGRYSLAEVPVGQLLFVSDWEISNADSTLLMTSLSRGRKLNLWSQCDFTSLWEKKTTTNLQQLWDNLQNVALSLMNFKNSGKKKIDMQIERDAGENRIKFLKQTLLVTFCKGVS